MRVLVGCEFTGTVRRAFRDAGHDAWSCDILDTEDGSEFHYKEDIFSLLEREPSWDLMIAHPPCTYLTVAANRWYASRPDLIEEAKDFVIKLWEQPIDKIAIENPKGRLSTLWRKPDQYVQPWQHGHGEVKGIGLWLKNLPKLEPTDIVDGREPRIHMMGKRKGVDRRLERSRFYPGVAKAMVEQWT